LANDNGPGKKSVSKRRGQGMKKGNEDSSKKNRVRKTIGGKRWTQRGENGESSGIEKKKRCN